VLAIDDQRWRRLLALIAEMLPEPRRWRRCSRADCRRRVRWDEAQLERDAATPR